MKEMPIKIASVDYYYWFKVDVQQLPIMKPITNVTRLFFHCIPRPLYHIINKYRGHMDNCNSCEYSYTIFYINIKYFCVF